MRFAMFSFKLLGSTRHFAYASSRAFTISLYDTKLESSFSLSFDSSVSLFNPSCTTAPSLNYLLELLLVNRQQHISERFQMTAECVAICLPDEGQDFGRMFPHPLYL